MLKSVYLISVILARVKLDILLLSIYNNDVLFDTPLLGGLQLMYFVPTQYVNMNTRNGETNGILELLDFVDNEWRKFSCSSQRTMKDLKVPSSVECIILGDETYRIGGPRNIWFKKDPHATRGYNPGLMYVTEAFDTHDRSHQLDFTLSEVHDAGKASWLVKPRLLAISSVGRGYTAGASPLRD